MNREEAMRRIETLLSHVWMVRAFLKHSEEAEEDEALQDIHRTLYDYHLAIGAAWREQKADEYLLLARKKFSKLRQASEEFSRLQPEISSHTNFQMAAASLAVAVAEIGQILDHLGPPAQP